MREIPLTGGKVALVDDEDYDLVSQYAWHVTGRARHTFYARHSYIRSDGVHTTFLMHKLLTGFARTDHRDGNGLNNQRSNLRSATRNQNAKNRKTQTHSSRFKGVSWDKEYLLWRARITVNGRVVSLGRFANEIDAAHAYDVASLELHEEFSRVNTYDD